MIQAVAVGCGGTAPPPNIVLIIGDDHGYPDFGFMGSPIVMTPELDRIAQEGVVFTHGFNTASTCRYSLLSILTGLHPVQWWTRTGNLVGSGTKNWEGLDIEELATLPRMLAERGYVSFQAGKYWEGSFAEGGFTAGMKGNDWPRGVFKYGVLGANAGGPSLELGRTTIQPVIDFLAEEREQPFFLWFAPRLPHLPHDPAPEHLAPYEALELTKSARLYYGNITRFDEIVEHLMEELERQGLTENTLVVYLADNGWDQLPDESRKSRFGGPRGKNSVYELGYRTPILFHWPGHIRAGRRFDSLVSTVDLFATLLDVAGVEAPEDRMGHSLLPLIRETGDFERSTLIESTDGVRPPLWAGGGDRESRASFLRTREWRYVWLESRDVDALYKIREDPRELKDHSRQNPEKIRSFRNQILSWKERAMRPYDEESEATRVGTERDVPDRK